MTPKAWNAFKRSIDKAFRASIPLTERASRISSTDGAALTKAQYDELVTIGTDVVLAAGQQYAFGPCHNGLKLFRVVQPVERETRAA